jgi:exosortase family protein XrtF
MLKKIKSPALFFFIKLLALYIIWYLVYDLWLHPDRIIDKWAIVNIVYFTIIFLQVLGYTAISDIHIEEAETIHTVGIDGTNGLWIGDPCNGIVVMALFAGFIIAFPGKIKNKLWFIPLGIFLIHLVNILRVVALSIIVYYAPQYLDFNHTYTFTIVVYSVVFILWYIWTKKYSSVEKSIH